MNIYPSGTDVVVQSRLTPPRLPQHWLIRTRLEQLIGEIINYPLTIIQAGAGYGKSSVLASFAARSGWQTLWLRLCPEDADPHHLLHHLIHACQATGLRVGREALAALNTTESSPALWWSALDLLTNDLLRTDDRDLILILDDLHCLHVQSPGYLLLERLLGQQPPNLHLVIATRQRPDFALLPGLRARGELLELHEAELAFTQDEIADLLEAVYRHPQSEAAVLALRQQTGGWAVGLRLLAQALQADETATLTRFLGDPGGNDVERLLDCPIMPRAALFDYFLHEVFEQQNEQLQHSLLRFAALDDLDVDSCRFLLDMPDAGCRLSALRYSGVFIQSHEGEPDRFHPLFLAFLRDYAARTLPEWSQLHHRAAELFHAAGDIRRELHHLIAAARYSEAVRICLRAGATWITNGEAAVIPVWVRRFPSAVVDQTPELLCLHADALRLLGQFDAAHEQFSHAEARAIALSQSDCRITALCGLAQLELDRGAPAAALPLLQQARFLSYGTQSGLRRQTAALLCEARLQQGNLRAAQRIAGLCDRAGIDLEYLRPQLLLRGGQFHEAHTLLERRTMHPADKYATLALLHALEGSAGPVRQIAEQALSAAQRQQRTIAEVIAHTRMGHALQIGPAPDRHAARRHYTRALELAEEAATPSMRSEACLGLTLLDGFALDLMAAEEAAHEGLALAYEFGDSWIADRIELALAAIAAAADLEEADPRLEKLLCRLEHRHDPAGAMLAHLWAAIRHRRMGRSEAFALHARTTVELVQRHGYTGLLTGHSLLGPRDRMMLAPILLSARECPSTSAEAQSLLLHGFPLIAGDESSHQYHPGVSLRIQALDRLRVWRGVHEIEPRRWHRKKAVHLLGLLITNRHRWLQRDQICETLWPDEDHDSAETQFKVTLNALITTLEPDRPPRLPSFFIRRHGGAYRLYPPEGLWLDVELFETHLANAALLISSGQENDLAGARNELAAALALYRSDYLIDCLYEEWSHTERERLQTRYLEAAAQLAQIQLQQGQNSDAIRICEQILGRDPCWEEAYTIMMRAYAHQGNRRRALMTYERCQRALREHLGVAPLPQTTRLYEELREH